MNCDELRDEMLCEMLIGGVCAPNDPEETLTVAFTIRELCLVNAGLLLVGKEYPSMDKPLAALSNKLMELWEAQGLGVE